MKLVLDASMALAWVFERKNLQEIQAAETALSQVANVETIVPSLWHTEIANALLVGERRGVISRAQITDYLNKLSALPITTDPKPASHSQETVMALAREYQLTAYDATYLELALRMNAALATFDVALAKAMSQTTQT